MVVLKIGGSLYDSPCLKEWMSALSHDFNQSVVIVPGGGPFADQVRAASEKWQLAADCAHDMAVLGMQQFGHMMVGLNKRLVMADRCQAMLSRQNESKVMVWAPYYEVLKASELEKDWQTTSDSLALWLATKLSAKHLCLVKSAVTDGKSLHTLIAEEVVDKNFEKLLPNYTGKIHFYHAASVQQFIDNINNDIFS